MNPPLEVVLVHYVGPKRHDEYLYLNGSLIIQEDHLQCSRHDPAAGIICATPLAMDFARACGVEADVRRVTEADTEPYEPLSDEEFLAIAQSIPFDRSKQYGDPEPD